MISMIKEIIQSIHLAPKFNSELSEYEDSIIGLSMGSPVLILLDLDGKKNSKSLCDTTIIANKIKQAPIMSCIGSGLKLVSIILSGIIIILLKY